MSKKMTQEKLNREFTVLRTGLAIGIGVLLSVIIILLVSDEPLLSIQYLVFGPADEFKQFLQSSDHVDSNRYYWSGSLYYVQRKPV